MKKEINLINTLRVIQGLIYIFIVVLIISFLVETTLEQQASDDISFFIVYTKLIRVGFLIVFLFLSSIIIDLKTKNLFRNNEL